MSRSDKVSRTFEFLRVFRAAEKNKEKVEANCTGFSAEFLGSQSVEMFCFARKTKMQMLTTSSRSLTRIHQCLLKSLGLRISNVWEIFFQILRSSHNIWTLPIFGQFYVRDVQVVLWIHEFTYNTTLYEFVRRVNTFF